MDEKKQSSAPIDLLSAEIQCDVFTAYEQVRREAACRVLPGPMWAIGRFDDVRAALKNPQQFSSAGYKVLFEPSWLSPDCRRDPFILAQDPPVHTLHRSLVNKAFVNRVIQSLAVTMRDSTYQLAQGLKGSAGVDFLSSFAFPYVAKIISEITGTQGQPTKELCDWIEAAETIGPIAPSRPEISRIEALIRRQNQYFDAVIDKRKGEPCSDVVSVLIQADAGGQRLSDLQIRSQLDQFVGAGLNTTIHGLCNAVIYLARDKAMLLALKADPAQIPDFIEELLRFNSPTHCLLRTATEDIQLEDISIAAGDMVLLMIAAANRDPNHFPNPDKFILRRNNIRDHLSFGNGPHACIGAALARLELKVALEVLIAEFSSIACPADSELEWIPAIATHGVRRLAVSFEE